MRFLLVPFLFICAHASAADVFTINITIDNNNSDIYTGGFSDQAEVFDQLNDSELDAIFANYTNQSIVNAVIDFRGLEMLIRYPDTSTLLVFEIESLGIREEFRGATRNQSENDLETFFKEEGRNIFNRINRELARVSPVDPVAGNPQSLMARMASSDFALGTGIDMDRAFTLSTVRDDSGFVNSTSGDASQIQRETDDDANNPINREQLANEDTYENPTLKDSSRLEAELAARDTQDDLLNNESDSVDAANRDFEEYQTRREIEQLGTMDDTAGYGREGNKAQSENGASIDASIAQYDLDGRTADVFNTVIDYKYRFDSDPRYQIKLKAPISYTEIEGAKSYNVAFAFAFGFPVTDSWALTTGASYGVTGSEELGGGGVLTGLSLSSTYNFDIGNYQFTMGNMIANYDSGSVTLDDYELDPGLNNQVFRNGILSVFPLVVFQNAMRMQLFLVDTRYSGDELYAKQYYEIGVALGPEYDTRDVTDGFKLGVTYLGSNSAEISGFRLNFGYKY